ncbi:MAG TPA: glycosyltransferase family 2 protein, partial [Methanosarcina sp.]|nr:glycosyltransferase family 2 protein [Methanosarcina sp.]
SIVAGNVLINHNNKSLFTRLLTYFQMIEYRLAQNIEREIQSLFKTVLICPGSLTAVKREVCTIIPYSDRTIVEDADFSFTTVGKYFKTVRVADANVYTNAPETLKAWFKQRKRWWFGYLQLCRIHKQWGAKNVWVVYSYANHIVCLITIISIIMLPYILMQYSNATFVIRHGILYGFIFCLLYLVLVASYFLRDKKLLLMLIPYVFTYAIMGTFVLSYIYLCHLSGRGMKIQFGPRLIHAR